MKDVKYRKVIQSRQWKRLRMQYLSRHPLCEKCLEEGRTRVAQEVHHIVPLLSTQSEETMRHLAYDPWNLQALCHDCHREIHEKMASHFTKESIKEKAASSAKNFLKRWTGD